MNAMSLFAALLLAGSAAPPPVATPQATAVAVVRARILAPAGIRRVGDRLEITTGEGKAPTQLHRTDRRDGGKTADFY